MQARDIFIILAWQNHANRYIQSKITLVVFMRMYKIRYLVSPIGLVARNTLL